MNEVIKTHKSKMFPNLDLDLISQESSMIFRLRYNNTVKEGKFISDIMDGYLECVNLELKRKMTKSPILNEALFKLLKLNMCPITMGMHKDENDDSLSKAKKIRNINKISSELEKSEQKIMSLIDLLSDRDTLRHLKNSEFDFKELNKILELQIKIKTTKNESEKEVSTTIYNLISEKTFDGKKYECFEDLDDEINEIIINQKTKKYMQKTFSSNYKFLINDDTFKLIKELVIKKVDRKTFHENFSKKIARYSSAEDFNSDLRKYIQFSQGWNMDAYKDKANQIEAEYHSYDEGILCVRIDTLNQSESIGSGQWCISYDSGYFDSYKEDACIYFVFDFNKEIDDNTCMIGMAVNKNGEVEDAYWKNDEEVEDEDVDEENKSGFFKYVDTIPELDCSGVFEESEKYYFDSLDRFQKEEYLLKNSANFDSAKIIYENIKNKIIKNVPKNIFLNMLEKSKNKEIKNGSVFYEFKDEYQKIRDKWKDVVKAIIDENLI